MPISPVYIPQPQGEQVPLSQIKTDGPFSAELTAPTFVAPQVRENGFGGPGHAILAFANNFLQGASQGRLRAMQQSEQTKKEHETNYDRVVQYIQSHPGLKQEFKDSVMEQALATKSSAGIAALGKGKGGKNELMQAAQWSEPQIRVPSIGVFREPVTCWPPAGLPCYEPPVRTVQPHFRVGEKKPISLFLRRVCV